MLAVRSCLTGCCHIDLSPRIAQSTVARGPRRGFRSSTRSNPTVENSPTPAEIAPLLDKFATYPARPVTLSTLLSLGQPLTPQSVLNSVKHVLSEVPRLFGQRVRALEGLPFIVGMNPFIAKTLVAHRKAFQLLATYPPVKSLGDNANFTEQLEILVQTHVNDIPIMAKGFQECSRYMSPQQVSDFLDSAIRNRIAVRLLAEQHIALSRDLQNPSSRTIDHIGVVHMKCSPRSMIKMCGSFVSDLCEATLGSSPEIVIDGDGDATFAYIPVHLEYILTEILKNSFRASVERHHKLYGPSTDHPIPPVVLTIASPNSSSPHPAVLSIRVRDQGGGVSPANIPHIFSYSFTTARSSDDADEIGGPYAMQHVGGSAAIDSSMRGASGTGGLFSEIVGRGVQTGMGTIAGLGYGLPMSRLYAMYFGGSLDFFSLDGWGSDVFVKLRCLDQAGDVHIDSS
ncbi:branched-chain alpha-ketoacid dehydrogenase [Irpex rosettiformis]|uniref:Branched-chain alpha-ketoacid dehydrogenase n=1 Tax=Irpex rosettiformis TaxID=378272 RepID=A0ACB8TTM9_9APHY|nr:branched-chain alpha-ketoacid dehydrogenase [Irpex rosettiformis]